MARLIDADAALKLLQGKGSREYRREKGTIMDAMKMLSFPEYTPTVEAVPVVRCKDCRKGTVTMVHEQKVVRCPYLERCMDLEGFCCFGERRKND